MWEAECQYTWPKIKRKYSGYSWSTYYSLRVKKEKPEMIKSASMQTLPPDRVISEGGASRRAFNCLKLLGYWKKNGQGDPWYSYVLLIINLSSSTTNYYEDHLSQACIHKLLVQFDRSVSFRCNPVRLAARHSSLYHKERNASRPLSMNWAPSPLFLW